MKKSLPFILLLFTIITHAQIGIGTSSPAPSAQLDVTSTTKGFLPPRMTTVQRDAIVSPATGIQIYNTTTNTNDYFNGTIWTTSGFSGTLPIAIGIGTNSPAPSAQLDVTSTTKGFLPPRMTTVQRDAIFSPATGLQVYNTTINTNDYYNGAAWISGSSGAQVTAATDPTFANVSNQAVSADWVNGAKKTVYSTAETATGNTWVDGKIIYRRVIQFTNATTGTVLNATLTSNYISSITSMFGSLRYVGAIVPLPTTNWFSLAYQTNINVVATGLAIELGTSIPTANSGHVIIEYTKL